MGIFGFPLALWALSALPALGAIYWLRNRYRAVTVSSLVLWETQRLAREGGRKFQRIRTALLFYLELAILALTALAATAPLFPMPGRVRHLVVLLDDSWSMQGQRGETGFRQSGVEVVLKEFASHRNTQATLILAGRTARQAGGNLATRSQLMEALGKWHCESDQTDWAQAIALARGLSLGWTDILAITDHAPETDIPSDSGIVWHAVGAPVANLAIVSGLRGQVDNEQRLSVEIANHSRNDTRFDLHVDIESETGFVEWKRSPRELAKRAAGRLVLQLPDTDKTIRLRLTGDGMQNDGLARDDSVVLLSPETPRLAVALALEDEAVLRYLAPALEAVGRCKIVGETPELIVTDKTEALGRPAGPWRLAILNEPDAVSFNGPYLTDEGSPLLEGTLFEDTIWGAARPVEPLPDAEPSIIHAGRPLIMAGSVPLLSQFDRTDERHDFLMRWNPQCSTLQNSVNFPILIDNCIRMCMQARPGPVSPNIAVGDTVNLRLPDEAAALTVTEPSGQILDFDLSGLKTRDFAVTAEYNGLYRFTVTQAGQTRTVYRVAANSFRKSESDLMECTGGVYGGWQAATQADAAYRKGSWLLTLLALALLTVHQALLTYRGDRS